jgi:polar amino acid transport system ATP-binding protein
VVSIRGVHKAFGSREVLRGVDLELGRNRVAAIIGPSGSGKSTLLRCIVSLEEYQAGDIIIDDELVGYRHTQGKRVRLRERELARQRAMSGMVFQSYNLFPHLTALQNLMLGLIHVRKTPKPEAKSIALEWLAKVGLADRGGAYPFELSGGQQQRVAIARAIATRPKVLLLDEVTSALDPELVGEVLTLIRDLALDGMTMLIVTHEMSFARDVASEIVFMDEGIVVERGAPTELLTSPRSERLKAFLRRFGVK